MQRRARLELREIAPRALHRRLHEIIGVVLIARQRAREAAQPRQQLDDAFTDFLRTLGHAFMSIIRPERRFSSVRRATLIFLLAMGPGLWFREAAAQLPQVQVPAVPVPGVPALPEATRALGSGLRDLAGARALRAERLFNEH